MRVLCVGRHPYLSEHVARYVRGLGVATTSAVGFEGAAAAARACPPDVVLCDYDLLATLPLDDWERDPLLSRTPVLAVSLTRRPDESHLLDVNGIAGFLYLPALRAAEALAVLTAAARSRVDAGERAVGDCDAADRGVAPPPGVRTPGALTRGGLASAYPWRAAPPHSTPR